MNRDGTIRIEFEIALPRQVWSRHGAPVWGGVRGTISGRADPARALSAFDASGQQPFEQTAGAIDQNVVGWAGWAAGELFRRAVAEGDVLELVMDPAKGQPTFRELVKPQFDPWTFAIDTVDMTFTLDPEAVAGLPPGEQQRLQGASASASGGGGVRMEHSFSGDIPPVRDPTSGHEIKVRCNVAVTFLFDPDHGRPALDPSGAMPPDRLQREALTKAEEWFWYGVKQSFYNWIYDTTKTHRRFVRDYGLIHADVMTLCADGLSQIGTSVAEAKVRYEALDPDSAWALTAPGQSGSSPAVTGTSPPVTAQPAPPGGPETTSGSGAKHQISPAAAGQHAGSDQAMAATIAIMDVNELPMPMPQAQSASPLPPIEESVWRHQKAVMKENPGLGRAECATLILDRLKADGHSLEDRRRIASIIGAKAEDIRD